MAITIQKSSEFTAGEGKLAEASAATRYWPAEGGKLRLAHFTLPATTVTGDDGSSVQLVKLPAGRVRVIPGLSLINVSALGASRVMDLGVRAYVASDGVTAVAAILDDFVNDRDVSGATSASFAVSGAPVKRDYFSFSGLTICALVAGGTIPIGATMEGYVAYEVVQ
jgi:hypothetical protein